MFNQTELRFPLIGDNIGGVLFHDMGNIYSSLEQLLVPRDTSSNLQDFDYMVHAVGFGDPLPHARRAAPRGLGLQHQSAVL